MSASRRLRRQGAREVRRERVRDEKQADREYARRELEERMANLPPSPALLAWREECADMLGLTAEWVKEHSEPGELVSFAFPLDAELYMHGLLRDAPRDMALTPLALALLEHVLEQRPDAKFLVFRWAHELLIDLHAKRGAYTSKRLVEPGSES